MNRYLEDLSKNLKMEAIDGEKHIEREYTAYARVEDFEWTNDAPEREVHEQWNLSYGEESPIRGRLRLINNRRYTEAVKESLVTEDGHYECEFDISRDAFEMKKKACTKGYIKERFTFPIDGTNLKWEIDVFKSKAGGRHEWIKIDLEYDNKMDAIPDFPFPVKELVIVEKDSPKEVEDLVEALWETEWLSIEVSQARSNKPEY